MVEGLYEDDGYAASSGTSLPDIELEDGNSLRGKQRKRRRKRKQRQILKETPKPNLMPVFQPPSPTLPGGPPAHLKEILIIPKEEDKANSLTSSVRFAKLVDSRRISKDYNADHGSGAQKLMDLFDRSNSTEKAT